MLAVEELLGAERARVKRLECNIEAEDKKRQQLFVERRKTSETASRQLTKSEKLLQEVQSKVSTVTSEQGEWREIAAETAEELMVDKADVVFWSYIWEAAPERDECSNCENS